MRRARLLLAAAVAVAGAWLAAACPPECICLSQTQVLCNTGGLTEIPVKALPETVEQLSLSKNHFPVIRSDAFSGLRSLRKLSLDGNNISVIKPFAFRGLPRLRELSIQHTPLTTVAQFAFAGLQNLTAILLAHNRITRVEGYAFAGTSSVRLLLLTNNPMQKVETSAFSGMTNVERLIFPSGIRNVEVDAFNGLDTVGVIKMAFMDLKSLRAHTFRGLSHVHVLSIQESDLGVIRAGCLEGLTHVGTLNVVNNKIDAVQQLAIRPANRIRALRFLGNHLLETPRPGALIIQGVDTMAVHGNHFPCDCHVHTLLESALANGSAEFRARNFCISPLEMNGKPIAELDLEAIGRCQEQVTRGNLEAPLGAGAATPPRRLTLLLAAAAAAAAASRLGS